MIRPRLWPLLALAALAAACGGDDVALPPSLAVSVEALDFASVPVNTSAERTFALENVGGGEVRLDSVSLIEGRPGVWDLRRDDDGVLEAGERAEITVTFSPSSQEPYQGRVQIRSSEAAGSRYVTLLGEGGPSAVDSDGDGYSAATGDCDDKDPTRAPGLAEVCDGKDNNCDGVVPASEADGDYDGYRLCSAGGAPIDCDDTDAGVYPGAEEICDDKDTDCDGRSQDRQDVDGDGLSVCDGDCNDGDAQIAPGLTEACDGKDSDCDGKIDNQDADGDGHSLCDGSGDCDDNDPLRHPTVVSPEGGGDDADGSPQRPYGSLGEALSAGAEGDDDCPILLLEGSYIEAITLRGAVAPVVAGERRDGVLITGSGEGPAVQVAGGASLTLRDLTLGGSASPTDGGAITVQDGVLILEGVRIRENTSGGDGGAIAVDNGALTLVDCIFEENTAADDGGAISAIGSTVSASGCAFLGNTGKRGGALFATSSALTVEGGIFEGNVADTEGGAGWIGAGGSLWMSGVRLWANSAAGKGGALLVSDLEDDASLVAGCLVQGNVAGGDGGGIAVRGSRAAFTLRNNTFTENVAGGGGEGGLGAGIYVGAGEGDLRITANILAWGRGATGLHRETSAGETTYNSVFNTSGGQQFGGALADLNHSVDATPPEASPGREGNRNENPAFTDFIPGRAPGDNDLRLRQDSPCRDSGPGDEPLRDLDGTQNDRGAYGGPSPFPG